MTQPKKKKKVKPVDWEYDVTMPMLPAGATSPVMDYQQMSEWLNHRADHGWEFVGHGQTNWSNGTVQDWWIFRRPKAGR